MNEKYAALIEAARKIGDTVVEGAPEVAHKIMALPKYHIAGAVGGSFGYANAGPGWKNKVKGTAVGAAGGIVGAQVLHKQIKGLKELGSEIKDEATYLHKKAKVKSLQEQIREAGKGTSALTSVTSGALAGSGADFLTRKSKYRVPLDMVAAGGTTLGVNKYLDKILHSVKGDK
jgi:hypothetical protein